MEIISYDFHDVRDPDSWSPGDADDFEEWINVTVGERGAGSNYQVHICTPLSISRIHDKRGCFLIDRWSGVSHLLQKLNAFIKHATRDPKDHPDHALARHWLWEYGPVPKRSEDST